MILLINEISKGNRSSLPPESFYQEFQVWAQSFNQMLLQLDTYYQDIYQQKLLIKNAEIRALQSQMDPHFLFIVLNTIAGKAQMIDNEEIYEMVISLGSLMKMNTLSRNHNFTSISKEMEYVRLYVYLPADAFRGQKFPAISRYRNRLFPAKSPVFPFSHLWKMQLSTVWNPRKEKVI